MATRSAALKNEPNWRDPQTGRYLKGKPPGPGRPRLPADIKARLTGELAPQALEKLAKLMHSKNEAVAERACTAILDRAWGKPTQHHEVTGDLAREVLAEYGIADPTDEDVANVLRPDFRRRSA